jgi:hypothetical protein
MPKVLNKLNEGTSLTEEGEIGKGLHVFSAPIGDPIIVAEALRDKAHEECRVINQ